MKKTQGASSDGRGSSSHKVGQFVLLPPVTFLKCLRDGYGVRLKEAC